MFSPPPICFQPCCPTGAEKIQSPFLVLRGWNRGKNIKKGCDMINPEGILCEKNSRRENTSVSRRDGQECHGLSVGFLG
ncbi:hypothetical protein PAXRUDRAFT_284893 [Paxillus rubicundulus Ve08.2h10]|uniref:Uncharacterized protein n=1 Tax=Paxillus rubicundulus Ve08.2h10 TaxID=930991 RepID=A0A0D0D6K0_9AGAM|nr:hypothetical protein PAXRUDRAFT_284893 [Paxillus rubicundulus Ve08.2h10]